MRDNFTEQALALRTWKSAVKLSYSDILFRMTARMIMKIFSFKIDGFTTMHMRRNESVSSASASCCPLR